MFYRGLYLYLLVWTVATSVGCGRSERRCTERLDRLEAEMDEIARPEDLHDWADGVLLRYAAWEDATQLVPERWMAQGFMTAAFVVELNDSAGTAVEVFRRDYVGRPGFMIAPETTDFPRVSECQRLWKPGILLFWDP